MTTRVWQDGRWTIIHTAAGGSETTVSLERFQALAHVRAILTALGIDLSNPNDIDTSELAEPCRSCGNEERDHRGLLTCQC